MAQVLAEQTPWWAEGPALDPLGPLMHFQAEQGCHPSTQAVTCVTKHFLEQLTHIRCPQAHLSYTSWCTDPLYEHAAMCTSYKVIGINTELNCFDLGMAASARHKQYCSQQ